MYERLVGCVRQAASAFWVVASKGPANDGQTNGPLASCLRSPYRFLRFAMWFGLSRGTVGETVEFEHIEIGGPDEKVAVYR